MRGLDEAGGLVTGIAHKKNYTGKQRHVLCTLLMISWAVTLLGSSKPKGGACSDRDIEWHQHPE